MPLEYKIAEKAIHKWARRYQLVFKTLDYDELISIIWIRLQRYEELLNEKPLLISNRVRYEFLTLRREITKSSVRDKETKEMIRNNKSQVFDRVDIKHITQTDLIDVLIDETTSLTQRDKEFIYQRYYKNKSLKEVGSVLNLVESRCCQLQAAIINKLTVVAKVLLQENGDD